MNQYRDNLWRDLGSKRGAYKLFNLSFFPSSVAFNKWIV